MNPRVLVWLAAATVRRHPRLVILAVLLVISAIFFFQGNQNQVAATLTNLFSEAKYSEGLVGVPQTLNPLFVQTDSERDLSRLLFRGLTKTNVYGEISADLAGSWEESSTGQTYLFHLKSGQKFQNGDEIIAEDVVLTYTLAKNDQVGSPLVETFKNLEVSAVSERDILFRLKEPFAPFLSLTNLGILPSRVFAKMNPAEVRNTKFGSNLIGSTSFKLESLSREEALLSKGAEQFKYRFYKSQGDLESAVKLGEVKAAGIITSVDFSEWKNLQVLSSPLYQRYVGIFYNLRGGATSEKGVRQGLSLAVDKSQLIKDVLSGNAEPAYTPIPPVSWAKIDNPRRYDFNQDLAKSSLDKASWTGGPVRQKDKNSLEISLSYIDGEGMRRVAEAISQSWAGVGVRAILKAMDAGEFRRLVIEGKDFQAAIFTQEVGSDPDQYVLWHTTQAESTNITGLKLAKLDKALEDGRHLVDPKARQEKYADFQRFLLDEAPVTFLYYPKYSFVVSTKVQGIDLKPLGLPMDRYTDISSWKINRTIL